MKVFHSALLSISVFLFMLILLICSVEIVAYHLPNYYEKEYSKYNITEAAGINMPDLLKVTDDMMAYLRGNKDSLSDIRVTIKDVSDTPFFNEKEILHMEDVRNLFITAMFMRRISILFIIFSLVFIALTGGKILKLLPKFFLSVSAFIFIIISCLLALLVLDFNKYFIIFHEIFFNNDLWLLDPRTDNLINIVPEGFFFDTAINIGVCFFILFFISLIINIFLIYKEKANKV